MEKNRIISYIVYLLDLLKPRRRQVSVPTTCLKQKADCRGFTLVEALMVLAILALLAVIAIPLYTDWVARTRNIAAIADIRVLENIISAHEASNGTLPSALDVVGAEAVLDPWGRLYQYTVISSVPIGLVRKDKFLVPLNTGFDLYSMGPDGKSKPPLTAKDSWDDIIRANDGGFIGLASEY
jgi:general secretion pathway protein G